MGQTVHHKRPKKTAAIIIKGHQYDQTTKFERFVFLSHQVKSGSLVVTPRPPAISNTKTVRVNNCGTIGNHLALNNPLIYLILNRFI
jgi:hypothetical protein